MSFVENKVGWEWFWRKNIGAWLFDERGSGKLRDRSRYANHGALSGSSIVSVGTPFGIGKDFSGDANNDRYDLGSIISANPLSLSGSENHSIMWRARVNSGTLSNTFPRVIDKSDAGSAANGWALWFREGTESYEYVNASGSGSQPPGSSTTRDAWEIWTISQIGSGITAGNFDWYKDGIQVAESGTTNASPSSTTTNAAIGNWNHSTDRAFDGQIDFLYVFKPALIAAEIKMLISDLFGPFRSRRRSYFFVTGGTISDYRFRQRFFG